MRWLKASKGYISKRNVWGHLSGFSGVRASLLWITTPLEAVIILKGSKMAHTSYLDIAYSTVPDRKSTFLGFLIRQASAPDEKMQRWKWKKCLRDGARFAPAATLGANFRNHLSARKWGITGKKVVCRITHMLRCTAVTSLHRTKAR